MYDFYIGPKVYKELLDLVVDLYNGEATDYDVNDLEVVINGRYAEGDLSSSQYDNLMNYMVDLMY